MTRQPKSMVPKVRFKGFTDEWEQRKLGEIGETFSGLSGKNKNDFGHGDASFITYMNVFSNSIADLRGTEHVEIDSKQNQVIYGDILFTTSSETPEEVGMSSVWLGHTKNTYLNSFCFGYRILEKQNFDSYYMAYLLRTENFRKRMTVLAQGISRYNISKKQVMNTFVNFPTMEEQRKIGKALFLIDRTITLHEEKQRQLERLKKALLQKMFADETGYPVLRFKGFTEKWEQRRLEDLGEILTGSTPSTKHTEYYSKNGIPWVTPTDIKRNITFSTPRKLSALGESVGRIVPKNTLLITCIASIGKNTILGTKGSFNQQINGLIPRFDKYDLYFLFTQSNLWSQKMKHKAATGTMQIVNKKDFTNLNTLVPILSEQRHIGNMFEQLDHLITLHQHKIDNLKRLKRALLQKMFV